jgi:hypothetical protein
MKSSINAAWIHDVAKCNGITDRLNPNLINKLIQDVEAQTRVLVIHAQSFQRRSKRQSLTIEDVNHALELNNQEHIYGLSHSTESMTTLHQISIPNISTEILLQNYIENKSFPLIPLQPQCNLHWLAVEGKQPFISENPSQSTSRKKKSEDWTLPHTFSKDIHVTYTVLYLHLKYLFKLFY